MLRSQLLLIVAAAALLAACGSPAPASREAELGATIAALESTIAAESPDGAGEQASQATQILNDPTPQPTVLPADAVVTDTAAATAQPTEAATADSASPATTVAAAPTVTSPAGGDPGVVTAIMQQLAVAGEPFATEGDPNAPLTIIEFSDYG